VCVGSCAQVFFTSGVTGRKLLGSGGYGYNGCDRSGTLTFVAAIRGPTAAQARLKFLLKPQCLATLCCPHPFLKWRRLLLSL